MRKNSSIGGLDLSNCIQSQEQSWLFIEACPLCHSSEGCCLGRLQLQAYRFGDEIIPLPANGIKLVRCQSCGLLYKDVLPSPGFLEQAFMRQAGTIWPNNYDFADEVRLLHRLTAGRPFDVLDIGPSNGGLLKSLALNKLNGRRSALDIIKHPGLTRWVRGAFIRGLVDEKDLAWSEEPYDIVTMFDIAEHLYRPHQAFANLRHFTKLEGFIVIETGDVESSWVKRYGACHWWYVNLFEHHVFWSKQSFEYAALQHGFRIFNFQNNAHKESRTLPLTHKLVNTAKLGLYQLAPIGYKKLAQVVGKHGIQPRDLFATDHIRIILQSEREEE